MARALHPALRGTGVGHVVRRVSERARGGPSRVLLLDVAPAVAMTAFLCFVSPLALADDGANAPSMDAGAYALCVAAGVAFLVRRPLPLLLFAVALATTALYAVLYDGGPIFMAALLALLAVVVSRPAAVWIPATLAGAVALVIAHQLSGDGTTLGSIVIAAVWIGSAVATAEIVRLRRAEMAEAHARAELAERSREEEGARRVAQERLRIAREVHDVVGHGLATISLQAGVAEHLLDRRPDEARTAVAAIRRVSKEALEELRAEIGALRVGPDAAGAPRRPRRTSTRSRGWSPRCAMRASKSSCRSSATGRRRPRRCRRRPTGSCRRR